MRLSASGPFPKVVQITVQAERRSSKRPRNAAEEPNIFLPENCCAPFGGHGKRVGIDKFRVFRHNRANPDTDTKRPKRRSSAAALEVTREAIALKDRLAIKVVWMQLGVRNDQAAAEAEAAGLEVVMNRCPKIEYGRLSGEIGWAGVNSGQLSSRRPLLSGRGVQSHMITGKR